MQLKHNLNRNYNLMGFDTIEINLVLIYKYRSQNLSSYSLKQSKVSYLQLQLRCQIQHSKAKEHGPVETSF